MEESLFPLEVVIYIRSIWRNLAAHRGNHLCWILMKEYFPPTEAITYDVSSCGDPCFRIDSYNYKKIVQSIL